MKKSLAIEKLEKHINMLIKNPLRDPTFLTEQILDFCVEELGMLPPAYCKKKFESIDDWAKRKDLNIFKWEPENDK